MKTEYKYIHFDKVGMMNDQWACRNNKQRGNLGMIEYYGLWHRWIFSPEERAVFSSDCLRDIAAFMEQLPAKT